MMTVAQKVSFELVPIDGPIGGFPDAHSTAAVLAETIAALSGLDRERLLLFGGWESATRGAGVTLQLVGERLGITDQFQGVDKIDLRDDGSFEVLERVEGGKHQVSVCVGTPAVLGWATGNLAEPRNNQMCIRDRDRRWAGRASSPLHRCRGTRRRCAGC